jgi:glucokinase
MHDLDPRALLRDERVILTLDAGGTKLAFSAFSGMEERVPQFRVASAPSDVTQYLDDVERGFARTLAGAGGKADAISIGFPGPADYEAGIIGDLPNLKGFRGGVPLGPFLEHRFGIPVFVNNDGNLFALGEWAAGFLGWVNERLADAGIAKRYATLVGLRSAPGSAAASYAAAG